MKEAWRLEDCVFCRIVRGEIPARRVYEDEATLAFMDVAGDVDGHILVIPKAHRESVLEADGETLARVMAAVKLVSDHLVRKCGYQGVNLLNASGACAGQSVPHLHIHLIPRRPGDGVDAWPALPGAKRDVDEVFREIGMP